VSLSQLVSSNREFREILFYSKDMKYVAQWPEIRGQFKAVQFDQNWSIPREVFIKESYIPIITREYEHGSYWVWDGQRRTLSALRHDMDSINAYISPKE
jgi:hypothetical protein